MKDFGDDIDESYIEGLQTFNGDFFQDSFEEDETPSLMEQEIIEVGERYPDSQELDKGGMKEIFSVTDKMTLRKVAQAKPLKNTSSSKEQFISEARLTAYLEHPNIVPVYDLGMDQNSPFFTMKLIEGENLSDLLKSLKEKPDSLNLAELMQIFLKVCDAVAFAHDKGIVHLDLKPANIRLGKFGEVILCDWGLAKIITAEDIEGDTVSLDPNIYNDITLDGDIKGSPGFLAPEQISNDFGKKDEQTDIYALGGILYNILTLKSPVNTKDIKLCLKDTTEGNITDPFKVKSDIPPSLAAVAMKALSKDKVDRYQSVLEIRSEVNRWLNGFATEAEDAGFTKALWLFFKRHKVVCSLIILMIALSFVFMGQIIVKERRALEARELYLQEKEKARKDGLRSVPHLTVLTNQSVSNAAFDQAAEYINMANEKAPNDIDVWSLKGKVHFIRQEYKQALEAFKNAPESGRAQWIGPILPELIELKGDQELLTYEQMKRLSELVEIRSGYHYPLCSFAAQNSNDLEYSVKVSLLAVVNDRHNNKVEDWDYTYKIEGDKVALDFSNIQHLRSLKAIGHIPVGKINIANTNVESHDVFLNFPLEEMDISGAKIINPAALTKIKTLEKIIVNKKQYQGMKLSRKRFVFE
ncbi:MAG: protein kinase [Lentisphaerales bacterium]|nr:protein kinase [Lentisphaerales bacterium]